VGEARMAQTHSFTLGLGATLDIGMDTGAPADEAYKSPFPFTGSVNTVTIELKPQTK
jgi:hypothetical protein